MAGEVITDRQMLLKSAERIIESCIWRLDGIPDYTGNVTDCVSQLTALLSDMRAAEVGSETVRACNLAALPDDDESTAGWMTKEALRRKMLMPNPISGKNCPSYKVEIFLSGPIEVAKQVLREDCKRKGLCVTIEETLFVYTGGEEKGYRVGLINYPRFPDTAENLWDRAVYLAEKLLEATFQNSALIQDWKNTLWISNRKEE